MDASTTGARPFSSRETFARKPNLSSNSFAARTKGRAPVHALMLSLIHATFT